MFAIITKLILDLPDLIFVSLALRGILEIRNQRKYLLCNIAAALSLHGVFLLWEGDTSYFLLRTGLNTGIYLVSGFYFSSLPHVKRFITTFIFWCICSHCDLITALLWEAIQARPLLHDIQNLHFLTLSRLLYALVSGALIGSAYQIWKWMAHREVPPVSLSVSVFLLIQLLMFLILHYVLFLQHGAGALMYGISFSFLLINVISGLYLWKVLKQTSSQHTHQQKKIMMESQLQTQTDYYNQLAENIEQTGAIYRDLTGRLEEAYALINQQNIPRAKQFLAQLEQHIQGGQTAFSKNGIVNAVLLEKASLCQRAQIQLEINLAIPEILALDDIHLCSVCSNILDNAIQACEKLPGEIPRYIRLKGGVQSGFLVLVCVNPAPADSAPPEKASAIVPLSRHGLGLSILEDICKQYDGELRIDKTEHSEFRLELCLNTGRTKRNPSVEAFRTSG